MRAVGLDEDEEAVDQGGMRNWEREGMVCWLGGGPEGIGGRPYRRGVVVVVLEEEDADG
jgi:NADPH-dependent glutamate synthase beta subunit-like oxidoreductase